MKPINPTNRSKELFDLYKESAERGLQFEEEAEIDLRTGKSLEEVYGASQWKLMWRKFVRNRAAMAGGAIILLFYLGALLANFIAPYTLTQRFTKHIHMPPQIVRGGVTLHREFRGHGKPAAFDRFAKGAQKRPPQKEFRKETALPP